MAVWIDETGTIVRPAEGASIEASPMRTMEIPEGLPERITRMLTEVKKIPDIGVDYRAAIVDWANNGASSPFVLSADEVRTRRISATHRRPGGSGHMVARGAPPVPRQLDVQAPSLDAGHHPRGRRRERPHAGPYRRVRRQLARRCHRLRRRRGIHRRPPALTSGHTHDAVVRLESSQ
jgi:hypothetical protein